MNQKGVAHIKSLIVTVLGIELAITPPLLWMLQVAATPETAWERVFNSFLGSLPALIVAAGAAWAGVYAARTSAKNAQMAQAAKLAAEEVSVKVDANTALTKATATQVESVAAVVDEVSITGKKTEVQTNSNLEVLRDRIVQLEAALTKNQEAAEKRNEALQAQLMKFLPTEGVPQGSKRDEPESDIIVHQLVETQVVESQELGKKKK